MILKSNDIAEGQKIGPKFTCDGENISPHISWKDVPEGIKSFALSCIDPDAPSGEFVHWLIVNIPAETTEIAQGSSAGQEIQNDFGKTAYGGPCPPSGEHRYIFTIYALSAEKIETKDKNSFKSETEKHKLGEAKITAQYSRGG